MENKSSRLEDGKTVQGTDDHAAGVENNPPTNENPSNPAFEPVQLSMDLDHSQNKEWQTMKSRKNKASPNQSNDTTGKETYQRVLHSTSKKHDIGQRHVGRPSEGELKELETAKEVADGKQATLEGLGRGFLLKTKKK